MCGIVGFFTSINSKKNEEKSNLIKLMSESVAHRGPDQNDVFHSDCHSLYLAHQRLSIHDLSISGMQPMFSHCGNCVIVFNGEIYNYKELKLELESEYQIYWRGGSDTEIFLEYLARKGVEKTLPKVNGMFSFAMYNKYSNTLILARDRFGEKPLYIYSSFDSFAFSSELKPIEIFSPSLTLNNDSIATFLKYSYIPTPYSIYQEVFKLPAAHYLELNLSTAFVVNSDDAICYWNIHQEVRKAKLFLSNSIEESIERSEFALKKSVSLRMDSDVPFGAFLSGGIDSTCIVALMQAQSSTPIGTFSVGFQNKDYNEAHHAKEVAKILGTNHHEIYLQPKDILDYVPNISKIYDEPFADSSQLPTLAVSSMAKKHVTVALTGDSGDELFAGYNRHILAQSMRSNLDRYPYFIRKSCSIALTSVQPQYYDKLASFLKILCGRKVNLSCLGDKLHKFARAFEAKNSYQLYHNLSATSVAYESLVLKGRDINELSEEIFESNVFNISEKTMLQDTLTYMQNDILTKVDRASMSVSLETRIPFLDNEVFSTAWSLPISHKIYDGYSKYPLRKIISKYVPDSVMDRPKVGFGVPLHDWLRYELKDWADSLLSRDNIELDGFMCHKAVHRLWSDHLNKRKNNQYELWNILVLQQWVGERR